MEKKLDNKERLFKLWEKSLSELTNSFNGKPRDYWVDYDLKRRNEIASIDSGILIETISDSIEGEYDYHTLDKGIMAIFFKKPSPLVVSPIHIKSKVGETRDVKREVTRRFLGIKVGSKTVFKKPPISNKYTSRQTKTDDDGRCHYNILTDQTIYMIRQGKVMSVISEDEYNQCIKDWREASIRVDNDRLDTRISTKPGDEN